VGTSSRSKILGALLLSRLMGLRKCRLATAGPGPVDVIDGYELTVVVASLESDLESDLDLDLGLESQSIVELLEPSEEIGMITGPRPSKNSGVCLPMRIEDDDESFCAATAAMCKSSKEGPEEIHMTTTIIAPGKWSCQRGPAGQGQKNVGGDENKHYRGRDEKNEATRKDAKSGESWVVKIKSKWLCFVNNHDFRGTEREETHQPVSLAGKRNYKTIESCGEEMVRTGLLLC
jgi:hypothetical protein